MELLETPARRCCYSCHRKSLEPWQHPGSCWVSSYVQQGEAQGSVLWLCSLKNSPERPEQRPAAEAHPDLTHVWFEGLLWQRKICFSCRALSRAGRIFPPTAATPTKSANTWDLKCFFLYPGSVGCMVKLVRAFQFVIKALAKWSRLGEAKPGKVKFVEKSSTFPLQQDLLVD